MQAAKARVDRFESGMRTLRGTLGASLALGAMVAGIRAIADATIESEAAIAQLNSALKNAGATGQLTSRQFQAFASEMQRVTTFTDEAVIGVESILLSFKGLSGGTVTEATKAVLDLSARLGLDLTGAAKLVGKALADPERGMTALGRAGVVFSESVRETIKQLTEAGRASEAQALILRELESRFGGAANAARNTFGGALTAVKNAFGDLLEAKTGMPALTNSLNEMADVLNDPRTKAGFDIVLAGFANIATAAVTATANIGNFIAELARVSPLAPGIAAIAGVASLLSDEKPTATTGLHGRTSRPAEDTAAQLEEVSLETLKHLNKVAEMEQKAKDFRMQLALEEFDANVKFLDEQERLGIEHEERMLALKRSISEQRLAIANAETQALFREIDERERREREATQLMKALKVGLVNDAISLLQLLGTRSKTAAKAAFLFEKAKAIASVIVATQEAAAKALAIGGPGAAAAAIAFGAARVAIIAATAIEGAKQISSGTAELGTPANPVFTSSQESTPFGASSQNAVQVIIAGNVGFDQDVMDKIVDGLREAIEDRDVIIFGPESLQAQQVQVVGR